MGRPAACFGTPKHSDFLRLIEYTTKVPLLYGALLVWVWLASACWAQTLLLSAALDGSVGDSSGGRIPGAVVTVRETATNRMREAPTDADWRV